MKKLNIFCAALIAAATLSCSKSDEGVVDPSSNVPQMTVSAYGDGSRTSMNEGNNGTVKIYWSVGDNISLHKEDDGSAVKFSSALEAISLSADFTGDEFENTSGTYYAMYPYNSATTADYTEETLTFTLSDNLTYDPDNAMDFPQGSYPSVAKSDDLSSSLAFTNLLGGLQFSLLGTETITSVVVTSANGTPFSGTAVVDMSLDTPELKSVTGGGATVTLDCGEGVELNETTATFFTIPFPPTGTDYTANTNALTITLNFSDGSYGTKTVSKDIPRAMIKKSGLIGIATSTFTITEAPTITVNDGTTAEKAIQTTIADIVSFASDNEVGTTGKAFSDDKYYYYEAIVTTNYANGNMLNLYVGMQDPTAETSGNGIFISSLNTGNTGTLKLIYGNKIKVIIPPTSVTVIEDSYGCVMLQGYANSGTNEYFSVIDSGTTTISPIDISSLITSDYPDYSAYQGMYVTVGTATVTVEGSQNWCTSDTVGSSQNVIDLSVGSYKTSMFVKGAAAGFKAQTYTSGTGKFSGVVTPYYNASLGDGKVHIAPQSIDGDTFYVEP